ncbi:helix-turn-helix domain-containing protein [Halovenus marina]|uniref:helix-turn-helix domain-containing protein n=1 Tax=Halovenus marina TaxID=3396621 RepID=UPI003F568A69
MGLDFVNRHVAKILLAVEDGDSINRISEKIDSSYSYTYEWVNRLEEAGVLEREDGVQVVDEAFVDSFEQVARTVLKRDLDLSEAYLLPNFAGMQYRYSKTDAVYIWTKGGYQIGRNKSDYPIFIDVYEDDVEQWEEFFQSFGINTGIGERRNAEGIHFVLYPQSEMKIDRVESASVTPLNETVDWAEEYKANFQPALEMLDEMYELNLGVEYRERNVM